jgi:hypothetical protein
MRRVGASRHSVGRALVLVRVHLRGRFQLRDSVVRVLYLLSDGLQLHPQSGAQHRVCLYIDASGVLQFSFTSTAITTDKFDIFLTVKGNTVIRNFGVPNIKSF